LAQDFKICDDICWYCESQKQLLKMRKTNYFQTLVFPQKKFSQYNCR
jgi:hypothetical protein